MFWSTSPTESKSLIAVLSTNYVNFVDSDKWKVIVSVSNSVFLCGCRSNKWILSENKCITFSDKWEIL